ncbi:MAG: T9SS type A sorting domain-containing protein [Flavobacterium sp.]|uniref:T9SS type A sorting domain-containing protein n=1 Tax=Flavobacterium sp. TaxID=239 RepID=UPI0032669E5A
MKNLVVLLLLSSVYSAHCQSWQWGKRGGSAQELDFNAAGPEEAHHLITDSNKNIYGISRVGQAGLNIDNVVKTNFDTGSYPNDCALFSFACDGSYRWSKIIGGINIEIVNPLQVDGQNNVYFSGKFGDCTTDSSYPFRIDSDFINTYYDCRILFLAKYNDSGLLQWLKRPQAVGVDPSVSYTETRSAGLQTDASGTNYWLVRLPPGTYADGAFVNSLAGSNWFILKYDAAGNYVSNISLDIQTSTGYAGLHFQRNPNNGQFYIYAGKEDTSADTATVGGNTVTHSTFLACFNAQGNFLWKREDTVNDPGYLSIYNLAFDLDNNIYLGGKIVGLNLESFLGFSVADPVTPGYVMKTNPDASQLLWSSNSNSPSEVYGGIAINGNELGYTSYCGGPNFTWGTQTLNVNALGQGQEVLLARFDKNSGACIGLANIPGNDGFNDVGASITADASGDYILGGSIGGILYFNNSQQIVNSGSQSDFFIAKYATEACSPLAVNENSLNTIQLYPNPTKGIVMFDNSNSYFQKVSVYNYLGQEIVKPFSCTQGGNATIDLTGIPNGIYIIKLEGIYGSKSEMIVKQ